MFGEGDYSGRLCHIRVLDEYVAYNDLNVFVSGRGDVASAVLIGSGGVSNIIIYEFIFSNI